MKELELIFEGKGQVKGYLFTQIFMNENGYIYSVSKDGLVHFEVFKRVKNTLYNCISYPSDKSFGKWAFTCGTESRALEILNSFNP